ncbi:ABC transporter ATP-binding protein [Pseudosulfitobacter pseudonitzschiae]|uniref:ABC transporter ATP-binding protein n=3 Tax=Pseudosulfitobacter pseudonitzschiae TaxID=1402135 RepID=UPI001AFAB199|nr:ABC transporter ATP-binding protein [Pseudosulfitobacter pseudonitzschiae]MBM1817611.1 ABC transporter ATP-binding protein [Pseudosulfitobacter pseudonitzschiae]MBM1834522.1 ABC transporter ATP-binding protein [Pseudosulfitobacter pseudonitzschiae]MBM1839387.1 ABC transporter ATP-binding protein [Pseudosulfitobacter pseudonitzschiae]MBM1844237.1 ABC transporter ATP-binding protein [Pseudosulfitobacter pseudonitzschiae]MBM1849072.1 ABC transporter ATP-binding protein [Pseudosulfitobacter pse
MIQPAHIPIASIMETPNLARDNTPAEPILSIDHVTKRFDGAVAVNSVSIDIMQGEFVTLLGPSGCGKSTLLRMIAGFETPTQGRILMRGVDMSHRPAYDREIGLVFQNLALFPHMNVFDNVAFGLRARGRTDGLKAKVQDMLALVGLDGFDDRRTGQISGGQRQRVALARSLVTQPDVLLLDEPLSALDLKLRRQLQTELKRIQQETGITFVFVTHDQEEALSMSDRIAVMNAGRVEQFSSAVDTYHRPATEFVARFVGETNLLRGQVQAASGGRVTLKLDNVTATVTAPAGDTSLGLGTDVAISIRPEHMTLGTDQPIAATVLSHSFSGATITYALDSAAGRLLAQVPFQPGGGHPLPAKAPVSVGWTDTAVTLILGKPGRS